MLDEVCGLRPCRTPTHEPYHLLSRAEGIDYGSCGGGRENTRGAKLGNFNSNAGVDYSGWVMPQALSADPGRGSTVKD